MNLSEMTVAELLATSRLILSELRDRGVIRTGNAPVGDIAEWLVARAVEGELARNSQESWDVSTPQGQRLQVKSRVVTDARSRGERQLSVFRSWDFDAAVIVLFDDEFQVWRASLLPAAVLQEKAVFMAHVNGYRVHATDQLLETGEDWTDRLRKAAGWADKLVLET